MSYESTPEDLTLLGARVLGSPSASRIAGRYGVPVAAVEESLLDFEAYGWVQRTRFAGHDAWTTTEAGKLEAEHRLAAELDRAGARATVTAAHRAFLPLNRRFATACTDWQIRPTRLDPMAFNDHTNWPWDERVLKTLTATGQSFRRLCDDLATALSRYDGYARRYEAALAHVDAGRRPWVDAADRDSCHLVWIQFHEDLLATLALPRCSGPAD